MDYTALLTSIDTGIYILIDLLKLCVGIVFALFITRNRRFLK